MINKFRYKKPARESPSDTKPGSINSDSGDTLKANKNNKTTKVFDNDRDTNRITERINNSGDFMEEYQGGVLDENMKKQLHVRFLPPFHIW